MCLSTLEAIADLRKSKVLVFTNGVFDILHAGHVTYLEQAKALGDILVVALNSDQSVRTLNKGMDRPINTLNDRARVVGALRCVDAVVSFEENDPVALILRLKPDIHVKGGDYTKETMPETPIVEGYGGQVVILPFVSGKSTTSILSKLSRPSED